MEKIVIKRNGTEQPFEEGKLNRWAEYATRTGAEWSTLAIETFKRLPKRVTSKEIHETMINVCMDQESLKFSRMAARLEIATIRKNMKEFLGFTDKDDFRSLYKTLVSKGLWDKNTMPKISQGMVDLYSEIYDIHLEYWQIKQWSDKYGVKVKNRIVETPHLGAIGIAFAIHGDTSLAYELARNIITGEVNLPTPVLNGCRNGDFDSISCCVISGGDTVDSIGVAEHTAYKMTAKKAGIGIEFTTRSKGDDVKNGRVKHLGKHGIYQTVDRAVKMFTQVSRGGSATMTFNCIDPELVMLLQLKTQRIPEPERIDKIDYSLAYNEAFLQAVMQNTDWHLISLSADPELHEAFYTKSADDYNTLVSVSIANGIEHTTMKARDILKLFLTARQETGRIYCINVTQANKHTPFTDTIRLSNLCQEICLPTIPYTDMSDLYTATKSVGETAFCSLAAINVSKVKLQDYENVAYTALATVDKLITLAPMMTNSMQDAIEKRRSAGIGITGLAGYLYSGGLDYDDSDTTAQAVSEISECHYFYLLKASQRLAEELGTQIEGIDLNWLPIDTSGAKGTLDWESLRNKPRRNSVLVAHMPTESSAVFSDATNGLYPVRNRVINKLSRFGNTQYIAPEGTYKLAWDIPNNTMAKIYSLVQNWTDQAISADYYVDFTKFKGGKVPLSQLMKEWVVQARLGVKTMYYINSNDDNGGSFQDKMAEAECSACKL